MISCKHYINQVLPFCTVPFIWPPCFYLPPGEQHTYQCLSCPFSSMTISQLKEHSLRDHGEALTLPKLRAATQAAHGALRPPRLPSNTEQNPLALDGMRSLVMSFWQICDRIAGSSGAGAGKSLSIRAEFSRIRITLEQRL